jgi:hypothetical protein
MGNALATVALAQPVIDTSTNGAAHRGVFKILKDAPEWLQAAELLRQLELAVPPTPFESTHYDSSPNTRRYGKIVRFSTIGPVKGGWMSRGRLRAPLSRVARVGAWFRALERSRRPLR